MALFDWTQEEKWRHIKHFIDTHNYSESNLDYLKSWITFLTAPTYEEVFGNPLISTENQTCPECGDSEHYRIIYTDDEMTEVKFYDCMMCHTHWDKDGNNLGKF